MPALDKSDYEVATNPIEVLLLNEPGSTFIPFGANISDIPAWPTGEWHGPRYIDIVRTAVMIAAVPRPDTVLRQVFPIADLLDDRIYLKQPIVLHVEPENEFYVARCDDFDEFGYGRDPMAAVDDFRQTFAELYWTLKNDEDRLGPGMKTLWERLTMVVSER